MRENVDNAPLMFVKAIVSGASCLCRLLAWNCSNGHRFSIPFDSAQGTLTSNVVLAPVIYATACFTLEK